MTTRLDRTTVPTRFRYLMPPMKKQTFRFASQTSRHDLSTVDMACLPSRVSPRNFTNFSASQKFCEGVASPISCEDLIMTFVQGTTKTSSRFVPSLSFHFCSSSLFSLYPARRENEVRMHFRNFFHSSRHLLREFVTVLR